MLCPSCRTSQPLSFRCKRCGGEMMRGSYAAAPATPEILDPTPTPRMRAIPPIQPMPLPATGMALDNPYAAPQSAAAPHDAAATRGVIASRSSRLAAVMIDYVCALVVTLPLLSSAIFVSASDQSAAIGGIGIAASLAGLGVLGLIQASYLVREGQTLGKKLMKIRIVDHVDGHIPHWTRVLGTRYLLNTALRQIPLYAFADVMCIFGQEQRCLHDYIARTKVIEV